MNRPARFEGPKKPTNVSLSAELVDEAKKLGINRQRGVLDRACRRSEEGARSGVERGKSRRDRSFQRICSQTRLPLAKYRQFWMAQFDVWRTSDDDLVIDCQSDLLGHLNTRLVAPLLTSDRFEVVARQLNPSSWSMTSNM